MFTTSELTLRYYADALRRRWWVLVAVTIVVVVAGSLPDVAADPLYASSVTVRVDAREETTTAEEEIEFADVDDQAFAILTDVEVIESTSVRSRVEELLGGGGATFDSVSAAPLEFSSVLRIRVTAESASAAAAAADAYATVYIEQWRTETIEPLTSQADELRRRTEDLDEELADLDERLNDPSTDPVILETLRSQRSDTVTWLQDLDRRVDRLAVEAERRERGTRVVSPATVNSDPINPLTARTVATALVLGLLGSVVLVVVLELLRDHVTSPEDIDALDGDVGVLGSLPTIGDRSRSGSAERRAVSDVELRHLATGLRLRGVGGSVRSLSVTGAVGGEGTTTTTVDLAHTLAEAGMRVLLVDAELSTPGVHLALGLPNDTGLSSVLSAGHAPDADIQRVSSEMDVLTAGPPAERASALLGAEEFAALVSTASDQYDVVIIDTPPVLTVAESLFVSAAVDRTLVVARVGLSRRREVRSVLRRFQDAGLPLVGLVATDVPGKTPGSIGEAHR